MVGMSSIFMEDKLFFFFLLMIMKLKLSLTLILLMCILSGFSQTNERKPIGTLTVYRAKRTFTAKYYAGGSKRFSQMDHHYKKDEWVTDSRGDLETTKKGNYKLSVRDDNAADIFDIPTIGNLIIPKNELYSKNYQFHELLLSDIGDGLVFSSQDGRIKAKFFKHNKNGHKILTYTNEKPELDQEPLPTDYMFCLEGIGSGGTYCSILRVNGDHVDIYEDEYPDDKKSSGWVSTCNNPHLINQMFDPKGNMLCDVIAINDWHLPKSVTNEDIWSFAIAYLHDRQELYIGGGLLGNYFLKLRSKNESTHPSISLNSNRDEKLTITKKKRTGYLKFRDEPQYMIINVDIDWPIGNEKSIKTLQKRIIDVSFERNTSDIDGIIKKFCTERSGGRVITSIPKRVKQQKVPWYQDDLVVKCTQVPGRFASFQIELGTFNGYHGLPPYRRYVNYDIQNNTIIELKDIIFNPRDRNFQEVLTKYIKAHQLYTDISYYKDANGLRIADFALKDNSMVFNFDDEMEGYLEIDVPKEKLAKFMTDKGRHLLNVSNNSNDKDKAVQSSKEIGTKKANEALKEEKKPIDNKPSVNINGESKETDKSYWNQLF